MSRFIRRLRRLEARFVVVDDPEAARLVALLKERMRRCGLRCDDGGDGPSWAYHHRTIIAVLRARFEKPKATDNPNYRGYPMAAKCGGIALRGHGGCLRLCGHPVCVLGNGLVLSQ